MKITKRPISAGLTRFVQAELPFDHPPNERELASPERIMKHNDASLFHPIAGMLLLAGLFATGQAHAQGIDGRFTLNAYNTLDGTSRGGPDPISETFSEVILAEAVAINRIWSFPQDPVLGGDTGSRMVSLTPLDQFEFTLSPQRLLVKSRSQAALNGDHRDENGAPLRWGVTSVEDFRMADAILIVPNDPALNGKEAVFDLEVEITGSLSASGGGAPTSGALSAAYYKIEGNTDLLEGALLSDGTRQGMSTFAAPVTLRVSARAVLGPKEALAPFNLESNPFAFDIHTETFARDGSVAGQNNSGLSGEVIHAELELSITLKRIIDIAPDAGAPLPNSAFKSISFSGYDYLGSGRPIDAPEPIEGHRWINEEGGAFSTASNWSDFDENEIPDDVPQSGDTAIFDLPAAYTVDVGAQTIDRLIVGGDPSVEVSFINVDLTTAGMSLEEPGVLVNQGRFRLSNGRILNTHTTIGSSGRTEVRVTGPAARWNSTGLFVAGGGGETSVDLDAGGRILSAKTLFGNATGSNPESVSRIAGSGSEWNMGNAEIGSRSPAFVFATAGGRIVGEEVRVAAAEGVGGLLSAEGRSADGMAPSEIRIARLRIGSGGNGVFTVEDGAIANLTRLDLGQLSGATAFVEGAESKVTVANGLLVGGNLLADETDPVSSLATGELFIRNAGRFLSGTSGILGTYIGSTGRGTLTVDAEHGVGRAALEEQVELLVGVKGGRTPPEYDGTLEILKGGLVTAPHVIVADEPSASGRIAVVGESTTRNQSSLLNIRGNLDVGGNGFNDPRPVTGLAELSVFEGGEVVITGDLSVGLANQGEVLIDGARASHPGFRSRIEAGTVRLGRGVEGKVTVQRGGELEAMQILVGDPSDGFSGEHLRPDGELTVVDGGTARTFALRMAPVAGMDGTPPGTGFVYVGGFGPTNGNGVFSKLEAGQVVIGNGYELEIADRGTVESQNAQILGGGEVRVVDGTSSIPSMWHITGDLALDGVFGLESHLDVETDCLVAVDGDITTTSGARMCIEGTLRADQVFGAFTLQLGCPARESLHGASFSDAPAKQRKPASDSIGIATIDGDLTLLPDGVIEAEIRGAEPATGHDVLIVTGDATLGGTLHLIFSNYAPSPNESFSVIEANGSIDRENLNVVISGLKPGFESRFAMADGKLTLTALTDGQSLSADDPIQILAPRYSRKGGFRLSFFGVEGVNYGVHASTDLEEWAEVATLSGANTLLSFRDPVAIDEPEHFYRIVQTEMN